MRNDLIVKVTLIVNDEEKNEIYFDYLNKEGNYIGNIIVGETGTLEWHILDATYFNDLFNVIQFINGKETIKKYEYQENNNDTYRWDRAKIFIKEKNLFLNQKQPNELIEEEKDITR